MKSKKKHQRPGVSRRGFLQGAATIGTAVSGANLLYSSKADATLDGYYPATTPSAQFNLLILQGLYSRMQ